MDSLALDNISNFSWDKEGFQDEISFESVNLVPKKHISALKNARFYSSKIYNIFLLFSMNPSAKGYSQVSVKLPLQSTIQEAIYEIFTAFETLLKKNNAPFTIVEDQSLWEIRVAKKTGQPKDYIPAIDPLNLMKSVECYDNLVLCPLKKQECIQMISSSTICSTATKPSSNASNSPQSANDGTNCFGSLISEQSPNYKFEAKTVPAQQSGKTMTKKTQLISFDKDYNNSTSATCSDIKKSFKNGMSHYSSRAFLGKEEEIEIDNMSCSRANRISETNKEEISKMQSRKKKSFFSFLCC